MGGTSAAETSARTSLATIIDDAQSCTRCATMHGRPRVLSEANGSESARCLVVAEAPGFHGAASTGVPLKGDRTGDAFEKLLSAARISRDELFITNAVLCSPKNADGEGRKPSKAEVKQCTHFVRALIDTLDPAIVVTLGATALSSLSMIAPHDKTLKWDVGNVHRWNDRFVLPLYHPGARSTIQRPWADQMRDWKLLRTLLEP
jgi:uracil-DNA glycosylase family 4